MSADTKNPYTAEEMASQLFLSSPVEHHVVYGGPLNPFRSGFGATANATFDDLVGLDVGAVNVLTERAPVSVGYIRRDIYEEVAQRAAQAEGCCTDLAKLDASRAPDAVWLVTKARVLANGPKLGQYIPVAFQLDEDAAWLLAELYSGDDHAHYYNVERVPLGTAQLQES